MYKGEKKKDAFHYSLFIVILFFFSLFSSCASLSDVKRNPEKSFKPAVFTMGLYQKYISPIDGQRCLMYPSCSEYSKQAFQKHGFLKGWIMTCDRLLRCGRSELGLSPPVIIKGQKYCHDSLEANDFWWYANDEKERL